MTTVPLAYLLIVFPLAIVWHLVAFEELYEQLGYIGRARPARGRSRRTLTKPVVYDFMIVRPARPRPRSSPRA